MTAAEIQQRIDAWLDARSAWLGQDDARWSLASQWQAVSRQFGADSPAALGVLLGLVRAAWKATVSAVDMKHQYLDHWRVTHGGLSNTCGHGGTEVEALLAALEAAP